MANTSATTSGWSACPATAPPTRSASPFPAPPTARCWGKIDRRRRVHLEELEADPARFLPATTDDEPFQPDVVAVDLNRPMDDIRAVLSGYPVSRHGCRSPARWWWPATPPMPSIEEPPSTPGRPMPDYLRRLSRCTTPDPPRHRRAMPPARSALPLQDAWTAYVEQLPGRGRQPRHVGQGQSVTRRGHRRLQPNTAASTLVPSAGPAARLAARLHTRKVEVLDHAESGHGGRLEDSRWRTSRRSSSSTTRAATSSTRSPPPSPCVSPGGFPTRSGWRAGPRRGSPTRPVVPPRGSVPAGRRRRPASR